MSNLRTKSTNLDSVPENSDSEPSIHQGIEDSRGKRISPWAWIPTAYIAEGIPNALVMTVSVLMYKDLGISNTDIAFWTSWLYLPWVLKPLWGPCIDLYGTKRNFMIWCQFLMAIGFALVGASIVHPYFFPITMICWYLSAFTSATHDIACDGLYLLGLNQSQQAWFSGIRSTFFRIALILAGGAVPYLAGQLQKEHFSLAHSWQISIFAIATLLLGIFFWHSSIVPHPIADRPFGLSNREKLPWRIALTKFFKDQAEVFTTFFQQKGIIAILSFILLYRLGEAQLVKLATPFFRDERIKGGLGLAPDDIGLIYGTIGVIALLIGGIISGFLVSQHGLKKWIWYMALAINVPDLLYVYMSFYQPESKWTITGCIALEQLGYGFGFTGYMIFLMYCAQGKYKAAHYAIATGFMALGMMLPQMVSGYIQTKLGYPLFFIWACTATIPGFITLCFIPLDSEFGKKKT